VPGRGLRQLYDQDKPGVLYSVLVNLLATF
jgi:hypothetical protein